MTIIFNSNLNISDKIQFFMAVSTFLAVFVALFGKKAWEYINRPLLHIKFKLAPPDCHKTKKQGGNVSFPVYYFRFLVENIGKTQAEGCEIVLERISIQNEQGNFIEYKNYTPVNLKWTGSRNPYERTIQPERGIYCDLGRIHHPDYSYQSIYVNITEKEKKVNKFAIALAPYEYYYSQWDSLTPGKYQLVVSVYSRNAKKVTRKFDLTWSGNWKDEDKDMFKELVIA